MQRLWLTLCLNLCKSDTNTFNPLFLLKAFLMPSLATDGFGSFFGTEPKIWAVVQLTISSDLFKANLKETLSRHIYFPCCKLRSHKLLLQARAHLQYVFCIQILLSQLKAVIRHVIYYWSRDFSRSIVHLNGVPSAWTRSTGSRMNAVTLQNWNDDKAAKNKHQIRK